MLIIDFFYVKGANLMGIFMPSISVAGLVNLNVDQGSDTLFVDQKATAAWG